jgi:hypothetical protein
MMRDKHDFSAIFGFIPVIVVHSCVAVDAYFL